LFFQLKKSGLSKQSFGFGPDDVPPSKKAAREKKSYQTNFFPFGLSIIQSNKAAFERFGYDGE
jgi:hypothetical protein